MQAKTVRFVDIYGVISLWGMGSDVRPAIRSDGAFHTVDGVMHFLSGVAGNHLLAHMSSCDLIWCSVSREKADEHPPPALALPAGLRFIPPAPQ